MALMEAAFQILPSTELVAEVTETEVVVVVFVEEAKETEVVVAMLFGSSAGMAEEKEAGTEGGRVVD
eukprot:6186381-Pleurochrysis_carterae.AAC.1